MGVAMLHDLHAEQDIVVTQMQTDCLFEFFQFRFVQKAASGNTNQDNGIIVFFQRDLLVSGHGFKDIVQTPLRIVRN